MSIYWWFVVILVTAGGVFGFAWVLHRGNAELDRVRRLAELDGLHQAVALVPSRPVYGEFPVDVGPLLLLSDMEAANIAHEMEVRKMILAAEAKIPPRWR